MPSSMSDAPTPEVPNRPRALFRRKSVAPDNMFQLPTLENGIEDLATTLDLFLENCFLDSLGIVSPLERRSLYHSLGKSILCFINAMVANDRREVVAARDAIEATTKLCYQSRRRTSIIDVLSHVLSRGQDFDVYSDGEVHAELLSGLTRLMVILLEVLKGNDFSNFVKNHSSSIKYCVQSFKSTLDMMTKRSEWSSSSSKATFRSGVLLGVGTLNLLLSNLPTKARVHLEEAGCVGDMDLGLKYLNQAIDDMDGGAFKPLSFLILISFNLWLDGAFDFKEGDLETSRKLLEEMAGRYKDSAIVTYLTAQVKLRNGKLIAASDLMKECLKSQSEWQQLHNACNHHLMIINVLLRDWDRACFYCRKLLEADFEHFEEHHFAMAVCLWEQLAIDGDPVFLTGPKCNEMSVAVRESLDLVATGFESRVNQLNIVQRMMLAKANRVLNRKEQMLAPAVELLFINSYMAIGSGAVDLSPLLELLDSRLNEIVIERQLMPELDEQVGACLDDYCELKFLKGLVFKHIRKPKQSAACFKEVIERKSRLSANCSLAGLATVELGTGLVAAGQLGEGRFWLKSARDEYPELFKESSILLRVDKGLSKTSNIRAMEGADFSRRRSSVTDVIRKVTAIKGSHQGKMRGRSNSIGFQQSDDLN